MRARDRYPVLRAMLPVAFGHVASMTLVGGGVVWGLPLDRTLLQVLAGGLCVVAAVACLWSRTPRAARAPAGQAGLALCSFAVSTAHGAGLMLVPALVPLCVGDAQGGPAAVVDALRMALAPVGVHAVAMLVVTGALAAVARNLTARCGSPR